MAQSGHPVRARCCCGFLQIDLYCSLRHKNSGKLVKLSRLLSIGGLAMSALEISLIVFAFVFGGALLGMYVRNALSPDHLQEDVKDVVRLSTGLIGTIAALVLGLLIASAKSSYDTKSTQIKQVTSNIILLDQLLEQYGPDAHNLRVILRAAVPRMVDRVWNEGDRAKTGPFVATAESLAFINKVQELQTNNDAKSAFRARVLGAASDLAQSRLSLFTQAHDSIPTPFLAILSFWLAIIFASFGLFVRPNPIVMVTFFVGALSVSGAVYLILEMNQPFAGLLQISSEPLRNALVPLAP